MHNGYIQEILEESGELYLRFEKDNELDSELYYPIQWLTEKQKNMVILGLIVRYDQENGILYFMLPGGENWTDNHLVIRKQKIKEYLDE